MFFLKGYLICPLCNKKLRGSFSQGKTKKYPYYHCIDKCKTRISASLLNNSYYEELQKLKLSNNVDELFRLVLRDINLDFQKTNQIKERHRLSKQLGQQELMISKVRKLFAVDRLKFDDFSAMKNEYISITDSLRKELKSINLEIKTIDKNLCQTNIPFSYIFGNFNCLNTADKKQLVSLIPPGKVNFQTGEICMNLNSAMSKILLSGE